MAMLWNLGTTHIFKQIIRKNQPSVHHNASYFIHLCWSFPCSLNKNGQESPQNLETLAWTLYQPRLLFFYFFDFLFFCVGDLAVKENQIKIRENKKENKKTILETLGWTLSQPRFLYFFVFSGCFLFLLCRGVGRRRKKNREKKWSVLGEPFSEKNITSTELRNAVFVPNKWKAWCILSEVFSTGMLCTSQGHASK